VFRKPCPWLLAAAFVVGPMVPVAAVHAAGAEQGDVAVVELRRIGSHVSVGGTIVPAREITFTAQLPGRVESIAGEEGSRFEQGDVLVAIDEEQLLAQRKAAVAQIANAEAALRNAGVQYSRELRAPRQQQQGGMGMPMMDMMPMMGGSKDKTGIERRADLYTYSTAIEQARSSLLQAQSRLQEIDAKLRDTRSVAPFAGVVVAKLVEQGDTVQPGQPLLNYADMKALQVQADIPARLAVGLRAGRSMRVRLDDPAQTEVQARVAQVFPMADPVRHTIRVKFDLPSGVAVSAGMYVEVLVPEPAGMATELPVIPKDAVVMRAGLPMVRVVGPAGDVQLRLVRLGEPVDEDNVAVLTGLVPGDRVVVGR
jgi:multidrug efflux pump subunit AcrA (membrane-fusion protein)